MEMDEFVDNVDKNLIIITVLLEHDNFVEGITRVILEKMTKWRFLIIKYLN